MNTRSLDAHVGSQHVDGHTGFSIDMGPNYRSQYTITPAVATLKMGGKFWNTHISSFPMVSKFDPTALLKP